VDHPRSEGSPHPAAASINESSFVVVFQLRIVTLA
jgi:hypothetical protein